MTPPEYRNILSYYQAIETVAFSRTTRSIATSEWLLLFEYSGNAAKREREHIYTVGQPFGKPTNLNSLTDPEDNDSARETRPGSLSKNTTKKKKKLLPRLLVNFSPSFRGRAEKDVFWRPRGQNSPEGPFASICCDPAGHNQSLRGRTATGRGLFGDIQHSRPQP